MSIGERIKQRRIELGLTQEALGSKIGSNKSLICQYEKNIVKNVLSDKIIKLAEALEIDPYYLITGNFKTYTLEEFLGEKPIIDFDELESLAKPLQDWLAKNFNPMCSVIVEMDQVIVVSKEVSTATKKVAR